LIVPIFLPHLGCGKRCIYCDQGAITERNGGDIHAIIRGALRGALEKQKGPFEVGLYGGNIFGIEPSILRELFLYFKAYSDLITNFRVSTRPSPLIRETIEILKESKVTIIELGIPSFNDMILKHLKRAHTVDDLYMAYNVLKEEGFDIGLQVMVGLPGERWGDIRQTANEVARLSPHYIRIYPLVVLKETELYDMYKDGLFMPIPIEEAVDRALLIYLTALTSNIKTIKMGLTDNIALKTRAIAGAYHPAFGYMVKSRGFFLAVKARLMDTSAKGRLTICLNRRDIPHLVGYNRSNIEMFKKEGIEIEWRCSDMEMGSFLIEGDGMTVEGTVYDALHLMEMASTYHESLTSPIVPS
jgi:hypothetical protein